MGISAWHSNAMVCWFTQLKKNTVKEHQMQEVKWDWKIDWEKKRCERNVVILRSITHRTALRSLKPYRMHVKIPMLCPHPFCVYICVCLYPGGLLPHQGSGTMDPERISSTWTGVVRKTSYPLFSLFLFLALFPSFPFVSLYYSKHHISPNHSSLTNGFVLPLAKVSTVHY